MSAHNESQTPDGKKYIAILIPKTHWDREHSRSFEQLRWHLVNNVVDPLLDYLTNDPDYQVFMFDGQSLAIDDYLEMRPEREADIKRFVREGRLVIGPFLVGPDEHLPSGESLVRCLLLGHQMALGYGGVMKVGYNPDAFGHVAQLPQILRGFDIDATAFMRGVGPEIGKWGTDFLWAAPNGSEVMATHFLYVNAGFLPNDIDKAAERLGNSIAEMQPKELPYFVLMHGEDGSVPYKKMPQAVKRANEVLEDIEIKQGTLEDYFNLLRPEKDRLPRYEGELRKGGYTVVLSGVYSSRTSFKQENVRTQTLLEKFAEPLAAFAWSMYGDRHPSSFLAKAWRQHAENHFHDTIASCSADVVYRDGLQRYAHSQQIGEQLKSRALKVIARTVNMTPPEVQLEKPWTHRPLTPILVYNPLPHTRSEMVTRRVCLPAKEEGKRPDYVLFDANGNIVTSQVRDCRIAEEFWFLNNLTTWGHPFPAGTRTRTFDLSFLTEDLPACGYRTYYYCEIQATRLNFNHPFIIAPTSPGSDLQVTNQSMENSFLAVTCNGNGTLDVTDKTTGQVYRGLHYFEDEDSACGEYHHYTSSNSEVVTTLTHQARVSLTEQGPACATFKIELDLLLPEGLTEDTQGRSEKLASCPITTYVTLAAHSRRLDFKTKVVNNAKDHRLRVRFPSGLQTDSVQAESAFHVIDREIALEDGTGWEDPPVSWAPHQSFVSLSDGKSGLTVINKGIPEYAAEKDPDGVTLSLTLLRATGWIGREFYNSGFYKIATPDAQSLGPQEFEYALLPHPGTWSQAIVWRDAHQFNAPCEVIDPMIYPYVFPWDCSERPTTKGLAEKSANRSLPSGDNPQEASFLTLNPPELVVTAIKKAEEEDAMVVRLYNISNQPVNADLSVQLAIEKVWKTNMLEEDRETVDVTSGNVSRVSLPVKAHEIVTLKLLPQT